MSAALGHRKRNDDDEESSSASEEEGMMTPASTTAAPVAAAAPAAAKAAAPTPVVATVGPQALAAAMAALGQAVSGLANVVVSAPPASSPVLSLGDPTLPKSGDTTVITIRYNVTGPASSMVDAKGNACLPISVENAKVEYETPAIAEAAASGKKLFMLTKVEQDGSFSQPCDLELSYPTIMTQEGLVLQKVLDQATLSKGRGIYSFVVLDRPLTQNKLKFVQQQGKYHGKNLERVFIDLQGTGRVLILGQNPASMALGKLKLNATGELITFKEVEGGARTIAAEHKAAVFEFASKLLAGELSFVDPTKFRFEIRPLAATDVKGRPLKATFAARPDTIVQASGTIKLTCAFCDSIPAAPSQ